MIVYEIEFSNTATADIEKHKKAGNKAALLKINAILNQLVQTPFEGIGKPEPLKHSLTGFWSRRINKEHRLIYTVEEECVYIASAYGHYI